VENPTKNLEKAKCAARAVGLTPSTLYRAAERGEVPCYRLGRAVRFDVEELRQWMRDQAKQNAGGEAVLA
jgi:excisionase family DNA binding protein